MSKRTSIVIDELNIFENGLKIPSLNQIEKIANALTINIRDLLSNDKIEDKVIVLYYNECKTWFYPENTKIYELRQLASTTALPFSKSFEIKVLNSTNSELDLKSGLHQYIYNVGNNAISLSWMFNDIKYNEIINPGDSLYLKPFIKHNLRGNGKLLILRVGGKVAGDSQRELSIVGKKNTLRAISETMQWFNPKGSN
jgi:methylphosphonate synthase